MATPFTDADARFMRQALTLAKRAQGRVEPNPLVGAVIVRHEKLISQAAHLRFGGPHAEVNALQAAGRSARGATLYVTLEPCCHWGKTPPCTAAILAAGISRVVVAMIDPFSKVRGKGLATLRKAGLRVDVGLLEEEARFLNAPFITRLSKKRPFVIAKWAQSIDGCSATATGESRWISSEISREFVQKIRGRVDAIVVGIGTALTDDPLLMARPSRGADIRRIATRIVIDTHCRLPLTSQLRRTIPFAPLMIVHGTTLDSAANKRRQILADHGAMMLPMPVGPDGHVRVDALLTHLATEDYANILVEGGPTLLAAFLHAQLLDEAHVFIAPLLIGGPHARHAIAGPDLLRLADASSFHLVENRTSGPDVHLVFRATPSRYRPTPL